jgi:uncharacterized membrane protein
MSQSLPKPSVGTNSKRPSSFRRALLKGLGVIAPLLLTIVLFLWAWQTIESYVLVPLESMASNLVIWTIADIKPDQEIRKIVAEDPSAAQRLTKSPDGDLFRTSDGKTYVRFKKNWFPQEVYETVEANPGALAPTTVNTYYHRYVQLKYLQRVIVIPLFLIVFTIVLYFLGKFFAAGVGRFLYGSFERIVNSVPVVSNVYSSVKQVTDLAFNESEIQFTRIVAVEYPRKGIWSMGFVTGDGFPDVRVAANEQIISVLMPTSPMPATGFAIMVPKRDTIDLNITVDQAIQFCVSCGVVCPPDPLGKTVIDRVIHPRLSTDDLERLSESTQSDSNSNSPPTT